MGWKNVKEHYRIGHSVQVTEQGICIGSPYVHNLIVVGLDGRFVKRYDNSCNDDLIRYQQEMDADPDLLKRLIESPDQFDESKTCTVWTRDGREYKPDFFIGGKQFRKLLPILDDQADTILSELDKLESGKQSKSSK